MTQRNDTRVFQVPLESIQGRVDANSAVYVNHAYLIGLRQGDTFILGAASASGMQHYGAVRHTTNQRGRVVVRLKDAINYDEL